MSARDWFIFKTTNQKMEILKSIFIFKARLTAHVVTRTMSDHQRGQTCTHHFWLRQMVAGRVQPLSVKSYVKACPRTFDCEVEAAQPVSRQGVGSTLQHHGTGLVHLHHFGHDLQRGTPS